jgi:DnaK suppressor protein
MLPAKERQECAMNNTLDRENTRQLRDAMLARANQLKEDIRQTLIKTDSEQYLQIADQVHDIEAESFADLMVDVNLAEIDRDLEELRAIDASMLRIADGSYGSCVHCGKPIELARLQATPHASRCFDCQTGFERTHYQNYGHTL